jgi:hypothetical protein
MKKYFYSYFSLLKGFQATRQASGLQKEHPAFQNMKLHTFSFLWVSFILLDPDPDFQLRIRITGPIAFESNPDPGHWNPEHVNF